MLAIGLWSQPLFAVKLGWASFSYHSNEISTLCPCHVGRSSEFQITQDLGSYFYLTQKNRVVRKKQLSSLVRRGTAILLWLWLTIARSIRVQEIHLCVLTKTQKETGWLSRRGNCFWLSVLFWRRWVCRRSAVTVFELEELQNYCWKVYLLMLSRLWVVGHLIPFLDIGETWSSLRPSMLSYCALLCRFSTNSSLQGGIHLLCLWVTFVSQGGVGLLSDSWMYLGSDVQMYLILFFPILRILSCQDSDPFYRHHT